jgi:adenosylhomocysteine nucleosidase
MIAIVGALEEELALFRENVRELKVSSDGPFTFNQGRLGAREIVVVKSGVGKVMAAMTAQKLIDYIRPSHIIFTGIAGALNSNLEIGDMVVGSEYIQHDIDARSLGFARGVIPYTDIQIVKGDPTLVQAALTFKPKQGKIISGRILSGDQFIEQANHPTHEHLHNELRGDAVEMEGASMAFVCHLNRVPFVAIRTISDKADHSAKVDFLKFLPRASHQSLEVVRVMVGSL